MAEYHRVCRVADLPEGTSKAIVVENKPIAVFHAAGRYFAIDDFCPHMGAPLSEGSVEGEIVSCPWHYWRFRLEDGVWADNPRIKLATYPVRVVGDEVQVQVSSPEKNKTE